MPMHQWNGTRALEAYTCIVNVTLRSVVIVIFSKHKIVNVNLSRKKFKHKRQVNNTQEMCLKSFVLVLEWFMIKTSVCGV